MKSSIAGPVSSASQGTNSQGGPSSQGPEHLMQACRQLLPPHQSHPLPLWLPVASASLASLVRSQADAQRSIDFPIITACTFWGWGQ